MEAEYWQIMEECFVLKHYGNVSLIEQELLMKEDRVWWAKRLVKDAEDQKAAMNKNSSGSGHIHTPGSGPR